MIIHRKYSSHIKRAVAVLAPLIKNVISLVGLLLAAGAIYCISTDPWFQDSYFIRAKCGEFQVIGEHPILCIRSVVEGLALPIALCLVFAPAPRVKLSENDNTLYINIEW